MHFRVHLQMHAKIQETNIDITTLNLQVHEQGRHNTLTNKFKLLLKGQKTL